MKMFPFLVIVLCAAALSGAAKRDWQDATIVKIDSEAINPPSHAQRFYYTIDTGKEFLVATDKVVFRWSKPTPVAVGDNIKWALHKQELYILSSDGNEHTLSLRRREAKTSQKHR
jgi:hypothetical protein